MVDQGDGFTRTAEVHRQLGTDQPAADNHYPRGVAKLRFAGLIRLLAVERDHQLAALNRRHKRRGTRGQHQLVVLPGFIFRFHQTGVGVDIGDPGVRKQTQVKLFCERPRRLAGEIVCALVLANDVA